MKKYLLITTIFIGACSFMPKLTLAAKANFKGSMINVINKKSEDLILEKKYQEAFNNLTDAYNSGTYDTQTIFLIGLSAREVGKYDLSIRFFNKALLSESNSSRIRFNLALSYVKNNKIEAAKKELITIKNSELSDKDLAQDVDQLLAQITVNKEGNKMLNHGVKTNNKEEEVSKINKKAEGLILKKEHQKALSVLMVSYENNIYNSQTLFLIGVSAREVGKYDLSIKFFNKILKKEPNAYRVRFDLAISYLKNNQSKEAKKELITVKDSNPPKDILSAINNLLAQINNSKNTNPKVFYGLLSIGTMYDNNVNYGPVNNKIEIGQFVFDAAKTSKGGAMNYNALLGYNKIFNNRFGASGIVYGSLTDYVSSKNNGYDLMTSYVSQGINIFSKKSKLYIPIVYSAMWIDSSEFNRSSYLRIYGSSPSFIFKFTDNFYTDTTISVLGKQFRDLHDRNSNIYSFNNAFNLILAKSSMLSLTLGGGNESAELKPYSNDNRNASILLYQGFLNDKLSTSITYLVTNSKYQDLDPIFAVKRNDDLSSIKGTISYNIVPDIKLSVSDTYSKNKSNISAFSYKKNQVSLMLSYSF